jgi:hypothetical protein
MILNEILARLENVKKSGDNFVAYCPGHDDRKQSLSVSEKEGKVLLCCHAGCDVAKICAALSIELKDLFSGQTITAPSKPKRIKHELVCVYEFKDENGVLLFEKCRYADTYSDGSTDKTFEYRKRDGNGYSFKLNGTRRVPYRLPELLAALEEKPNRFVLLTEGEKDPDNLRALGFTASSFKNRKPEFNSFITGANIVLLRDHDSSGVRQCREAAALLAESAGTIKIVDLYESEPLPEKQGKDVSDWLSSGGSASELRQIIKDAPAGIPSGDSSVRSQITETEEKPLKIIKAADVVPTEIKWLWHPYIPLGYVTLFSGEEGVGKSWVFCAIASGITNGFLPLAERFEPQNVLIFSAEDRADDAIVPRLIKCGAKLDRISIVNERFAFDEKGLRKFEQCIIKSNAVWIIIDPLFAYSDLRLDLNKPHYARHLASGFEEVAHKHKIAISYLIHFNKAKGGGDARAAVSSSQEFSNAARSIY